MRLPELPEGLGQQLVNLIEAAAEQEVVMICVLLPVGPNPQPVFLCNTDPETAESAIMQIGRGLETNAPSRVVTRG